MKITKYLPAALLLSAGMLFAQDAASAAPAKDQSAPASQSATAPAPAQDPTAPVAVQDSSAGAAQTSKTDVGGATDKNEPLFRGCLSGTKDNYILTDAATGKQFRLHSDKDIKEHVGQTVEVRGSIKAEGMDRPGAPANGTSVATGTASTSGAATTEAEKKSEIDVADVKKVAEGCSNAGASAKPESDSAPTAVDANPVKPSTDDTMKPNSDKPMSEQAPTTAQPK